MKYDFFYVTQLYSQEECREIRDIILESHDNGIPDSPAEGVIKTSKVKCVYWEHISDVLRRMHHMTLDINKFYFGLDLFETTDYETLHFNTYCETDNAEYGWHKDGCKNECHDIKLTSLLNLSEKRYIGGNLELFLNGPREMSEFEKPGSLLVFPSFTQHRVNPVTKGERITLSKFYKGPNFK